LALLLEEIQDREHQQRTRLVKEDTTHQPRGVSLDGGGLAEGRDYSGSPGLVVGGWIGPGGSTGPGRGGSTGPGSGGSTGRVSGGSPGRLGGSAGIGSGGSTGWGKGGSTGLSGL